MIDLHAHILCGLDDGARTMEESLSLARAAVADGTHTMVCTPHYDHPQYTTEEAAAATAFEDLRGRLAAEGIPLTLVLGGEVTLSERTRARIEERRLPTIAGGPYLLLELYDPLPPRIEDELFHYRLRGHQILLAHVERLRAVQSEPDLMQRLVAQGIYGQVTAQSLTGEMGPRCERAARTLVERRLVQVIASDAHNIPRRPPGLRRAVEVAARLLGSEEEARALVEGHPRHVLAGQALDVEAPRPAPRSWLSFFSRGR